MYRLASVLLAVADVLLLRGRAHPPRVCTVCGRTWRRLTTRQHAYVEQRRLPACRRWTCSGVLHPVWTPGPAQERLLRGALAATPHPMALTKNGAPGWTPGTPPTAESLGGTTAMTTIIQRPARDLHAGDIIVRDPDPNHGGKPVRWRVASRPSTGVDGVTIVDFWDIDDEPRPGIGHYDALTPVTVEPVGGAQ